MTKATSELLAQIHELLAQDMLARLKVGGLEAKDWAAIAKFLKDNNIEAEPVVNSEAESAFAELVRAAQQRVSQTASDLN